DAQLSTLIDLKYRQHHEAESGRPGAGASKNGRAGEDLLIRVPVGTAIYYEGEAGERPPWLDEQSDGIHVAPDDHTDELENVWIVDGRVIEAEAAQQDEAEPSQARAELLELGAPPEVVASGETISSGAQKRHIRPRSQAKRQRPEHHPGDLLGDLDHDGDRLCVAQGGIGGRGNVHFRSSTNRTPDRAEPGTE